MEAMGILQVETIDLMFLDIQMPQISGIDFLKTLHNPPQVIFTTAYSEYAMDGYELNVVDYLLKPFSFAFLISRTLSFEEIFEKCIYRVEAIIHH